MMEQTKIYEALHGFRGQDPVDLALMEEILVRFSQLVAEHRWIKEMDINPLLASSDLIVALDARVVLHDPDTDLSSVPKLAIRPYPNEYVTTYKTKQGRELIIRPIRTEDEPMMVDFHESLSDRTVFLRYARAFDLTERVAHERLSRIAFIDYDREMVLIAEDRKADGNKSRIAGIGRISKEFGTSDATFALIVSDRYQGQGLGTELLRQLIHVAREEGLDRIKGEVLYANEDMRAICNRLGFDLQPADTTLLTATLDL
jgi:acetyltransferase